MGKRSGPQLEGIFDFWRKGRQPEGEQRRQIPGPAIPQGIDFYAVLGVPPNAGDEEIRSAFRGLARRMHPDLFPGDAAAADRFARITQAYDVLRDPERRAKYDRMRGVAPQAPPPPPPPPPARGMIMPEEGRPTMFSVFRPSDAPPVAPPRGPKAPPPAAAPTREMSFWERVFGAAEQAKPYQAPPQRMFEPFTPAPPEPTYQFPVAPTPKTPPRPFMPLPPGQALPHGSRAPQPDLFPSVEEMAEFIQMYWPIDQIWEVVREGRNGAAFRQTGILDVDRLAGNDPREGVEYELAQHLGLDEALINDYQKRGQLTSLLWNQILYPMFDVVGKAFEIIKPSDLPGYFFVAPTEGLVGVDLFYTEQAGRWPAT